MTSKTDRVDEAAGPWLRYTPAQRYWFLFVLLLTSTSNYVDRHLMSVLLEPIKREFHASDKAMGLLTGFAFAACYAVLGIPVARIADRGNRRKVIALSITVWSAMTALCGLARSFPLLFAARMGVGIGEAGAIPPGQSLIADYFPPRQRGGALSIFMASAMFGYLGAFLGGTTIAATYGWRAAFLALGLPGLLIALLSWFGLDEPRARTDARAAAFEPLGETLGILAAKRSFVLLNIAMVLYFVVSYGAVTWFPAYLVRVLHVPLAQIGVTFGLASAGAAAIGTLSGGFLTNAFAARDPRWTVWTPGIVLIIMCPIYLAGLATDNVALFITSTFVAGLGFGGTGPAMFTALHAVCGTPRRAMAVAITFFFSNLLGLGLGPLITGALSDAFTATHGAVGLRYALMIAVLTLIPSGLFLLATARSLVGDHED